MFSRNIRATLRKIEYLISLLTNVHRQNDKPNVFLVSTPRSGSTWLMELIACQPGFKPCSEPFNLRNPLVRKHLGINEWEDLYQNDSTKLIENYIGRFCTGHLRFKNLSPRRRNYRLFTNRMAFKILHGCEDRLDWFCDSFNGRIAYLIRHPIAVSLSREVYPRLHTFLKSDYRRHFTVEQLKKAEMIITSGTRLEQGVLSWCLQNSVPLREATSDWAIITYEQLVLDPESCIGYLVEKLDLPKPELIINRLNVPSASVSLSSSRTQRALKQNYFDNRRWLIEKWKEKVSDADEYQAMKILNVFNIDIYEYNEYLPADSFWV